MFNRRYIQALETRVKFLESENTALRSEYQKLVDRMLFTRGVPTQPELEQHSTSMAQHLTPFDPFADLEGGEEAFSKEEIVKRQNHEAFDEVSGR